MKQPEIPKSLIEDFEQLGLVVGVKSDTGELRIGNVIFQAATNPEHFDSLPQTKGILLRDSTQDLRKSLEAKQINYIDRHGNLSITTSQLNLKIQKAKQKNKGRKKEHSLEMTLSPTLLVSPNGLAIVDALFRVSDVELKQFQSGLQFCKAYSLYQPKLSKIMRTLKTQRLIDLKTKIKKIPTDWWLYSFDNPIIKRKMTPFFDIAQDYYTNDPRVESLNREEIMQKVQNNFNFQACEGPTEVASSFSELIGEEVSLWVSPIESNDFKRTFKLIPGKRESSRIWKIAVAPADIEKLDILTRLPKENLPSANIMRAIWDLSYSDSRSREVRVNLLRSFLK